MTVVSIVLVPGLDERARALAAGRIAAVLGPRPLVATFGETTDANLARFLQAEVPADEVEAVTARLAALPLVDGAYVKPTDAAP